MIFFIIQNNYKFGILGISWRLLENDNLIDIELFKRNRDEHILNDNRAKIKKEINKLTNSEIIEEKLFISYQI